MNTIPFRTMQTVDIEEEKRTGKYAISSHQLPTARYTQFLVHHERYIIGENEKITYLIWIYPWCTLQLCMILVLSVHTERQIALPFIGMNVVCRRVQSVQLTLILFNFHLIYKQGRHINTFRLINQPHQTTSVLRLHPFMVGIVFISCTLGNLWCGIFADFLKQNIFSEYLST